jgi:uncharacterized protein (DUF1684 family)
MTSGAETPADLVEVLTLADWRRTVATLYVDVRRIAEADPAAALDRWRRVREEMFRTHPQSPVLPDGRPTFRASHFDHDPSLRFEVRVEPITLSGDRPAPLPGIDFGSGTTAALPVSGGGTMTFRRFGAVTIPFPTDGDGVDERRLEVFWMEGYAGGVFLPFRDATNGHETYGAGRYLLDAAKSADLGGDRQARTLVIDFNFAFQPSCAWDPKYACPLSPPSNRLDLAVRAGERLD